MLKHIALEVTDHDLVKLYKEILGGIVMNKFVLTKEKSSILFELPVEVTGYHLMFGRLALELFIHPVKEKKTFRHLCLKLSNAEEVYSAAETKGYKTYIFNENGENIWFIKDQNGNILEFKKY